MVEYRPVTLGLRTDSLRVIEEGIHAGDWIVTNGLQRARPGSKVQPQRATMSGTIEQAGTAVLPKTEEATKAQAEPDPPRAVPSESTDAQPSDEPPA